VFGQLKETPNLPIDKETGKITYTEVVNVDNTNKDELLKRAKLWMAKTFVSSKTVIDLIDAENGIIISKPTIEVYWEYTGSTYEGGYIHYTFSIFIKEGRYKYEITDLYHKGKFTGKYTIEDGGLCEDMIETKQRIMFQSRQREFNYYLNIANNEINNLITSLKEAMNKEVITNDNW